MKPYFSRNLIVILAASLALGACGGDAADGLRCAHSAAMQYDSGRLQPSEAWRHIWPFFNYLILKKIFILL